MKRRRVANLVVLAVWLAVWLIVSFHHERWRDEAEAWLFARDASYGTIVTRTAYPGQTALWFLLLAPLAKAAAPYWTMALLNGVFAFAAVALFLFRAPFPWLLRVLFAFSYYPLFEYGVIARTYALTMLLLVLAAVAYRHRYKRPLMLAGVLFLLFNVNVQGVFIAAALALPWLAGLRGRIRERGVVVAIAVVICGALLAVIQLMPPPDGAITGVIATFQPAALGTALRNAFFPLAPSALLATVFAALAFLCAAAGLSRVPLIVSFILICAAFTYLFVFKYPGSLRHHGFILLSLLIVLWMDLRERDGASARLRPLVWAALALPLAWSVGAAGVQSWRDVKRPFSGAKETAAWITAAGLQNVPIAAHPAPQAAAVLPYLPIARKLWFAGIAEEGSYLLWDLRYEAGQRVSYPEAVARARRKFGGGPWLMLLNVEIPDPGAEGLRLLFRNDEIPFGYADERFWLYAMP